MIDNLNYYRVFAAVAETGSFSRAAERLFISQPAVSKSISRLEENLHTTLLKRTSRGIELNDEGEILYSHLRSAFASISIAEKELTRINDLGIGELKIGVSTSLCRHVLLSYLKDYIAENPHIKLSIDCHSTINTIKQLLSDNIDLGLICETTLPSEFEYSPIMNVHDIFITSKSYLKNLSVRECTENSNYDSFNPWIFAGNVTSLIPSLPDDDNKVSHSIDGLSIRDILVKGNLMLLEKDNITRNHIDKYLYNHEITPTQITEINNMDILADFAKIGMGISAVVKEYATDIFEDNDIIELPLKDPIPTRTVGFAYKKSLDQNSPARNLMNHFAACHSSFILFNSESDGS